MAMGSTDGPLLYRVRRIVGDTGVERGAPRRTGSLAVSLGLLCIAISMGLLRGQAADSSTAILVHAPGVVNQTGIEYPAAARTAGDEGFVAIECTLDAQGNVVEATLLPSTTEWPRYHDAPLVLQNSVLEAVRKWKFASGSKTVVGVMFQADSRSVDSFIQAGDFLYRNGQVDEAFRKFAEAAAQHPEKKITFQKRQIEVLIRQGKTADALNKDLKILQEDPNDAEARAMQASYRLDKGDVESAIKELWDVMDDIPDNFVAHFNLGRAYSRKGDLEQAEVQFRAALRIKPDYRIAKLGLVELSLRKGDYGAAFNGQLFFGHKAREIAQEILKKDPQNADALQLLAMCDEMKY